MPRPRALLLPVLAAVVVAAVALLTRSSAPAAHHESAAQAAQVRSGATTVSIANYMYAPDHLTVRVGTRVTWTNHDPTAHTATALDNAFTTGTIDPHRSRTVTFTKPGVYPYHCLFHEFMTGTVTVVG